MSNTTKYHVGQVVWFFPETDTSALFCGTIEEIQTVKGKDYIMVYYTIQYKNNGMSFVLKKIDSGVFATIREAHKIFMMKFSNQ